MKYNYMVCNRNLVRMSIDADSMINAARKFLGRSDVVKMSKSDLYTKVWDCHVYKYSCSDKNVPLSEGYYRVSR